MHAHAPKFFLMHTRFSACTTAPHEINRGEATRTWHLVPIPAHTPLLDHVTAAPHSHDSQSAHPQSPRAARGRRSTSQHRPPRERRCYTHEGQHARSTHTAHKTSATAAANQTPVKKRLQSAQSPSLVSSGPMCTAFADLCTRDKGVVRP